MEIFLIENENGNRWTNTYIDDDIIHGNILLGWDVDVYKADIPDQTFDENFDFTQIDIDSIDWTFVESHHA